MSTVNKTGLNEIKEFLAAYHKKGIGHFTNNMILAWAKDAEFQLGEGNPPSIEINARDSAIGYSVEYTISDEGINRD